MKLFTRHYLGMGAGIAITTVSGFMAYNTSREIDNYEQQLAPFSEKIKENKQEQSVVVTKLENCLNFSGNQNECLGLSFRYNKLNNEYRDLDKKIQELTKYVNSESNKNFAYSVLVLAGLAATGFHVAGYVRQKKISKKIAEYRKDK
ncbi:MAG: hypothetical protein AABX31_04290 [Nanoarchaeota archaeon]